MLPVSSATTSCSCHGQIPLYGGLKPFSSHPKTFDYINVNESVKRLSNFSTRRAFTRFYSNYVWKDEQCSPTETIIQLLYESDESHHLVPHTVFVDSSTESIADYQLNYSDVQVDSPSVSDSLSVDVNQLSPLESNQTTQFSGIVAQVNDPVADIFNGGENVVNKSLDTITSSLNAALTSANEAVDNVISDFTTFLNKTGESAGNKLGGLSTGVKEGSGAAGSAAVGVLRRAVVTVEDLLTFGFKNVGYAYGSAKEFLPQEYQDVIRLSEGRVVGILNPISSAFQQVYIALEGFEERIGLDPNDPLIPVALIVGVSAIFWGSYRVLKYGGYAGDISPESAMELLRGNDNAVLIDIRPENLRDRDGVPDLRRNARFRYASITMPEVDSSVRKLLKGGRDVDDSLLAGVISNLKIVQGRSMVLVMDGDGSLSKSVARSLRKLGTKRPYQVLGGFQSWVKEGCRVKELKPETTFTILNEEAEAILEELKPTPLKLFGYGVCFATLAYSLSEWETTLQFIGVIGLGQTILQRITSYQGAEDVKQDLRLLLAPVSLGGRAISWAAGKLETNHNGLTTSPSSSDVQSRVLQAAAKLESQPENTELPQVAASGNEDVNISEA